MSVKVKLPPAAGEVDERLGSLSQVTAPLYLRIYLYWNAVLAGMVTVIVQTGYVPVLSRGPRALSVDQFSNAAMLPVR